MGGSGGPVQTMYQEEHVGKLPQYGESPCNITYEGIPDLRLIEFGSLSTLCGAYTSRTAALFRIYPPTNGTYPASERRQVERRNTRYTGIDPTWSERHLNA
ncbi:predicted protein [Pyrenophora tritici-repentis Pt-1C-BFP]|uniref:Uncharacterized protein n=1 Tax=Pyrenophora tritici-repentis (strain Pt-1C-BFP) TaxID=426418 RepID=B2VV84_PYRTR|nr:uncharacterized protein PTRG_01151 [Pyrenophora tritici-repentis Pt-1C-BFP]EDU40589.1 predicted protein [Pyrenophora tritici-repentis Pt-1C-BFP]